jgi:hypothetical protein
MGTNYNGYVIYGKVVDTNEFEGSTDVRGCAHPDSGAKFCPECGKKTWLEKKVNILDDSDYMWESSCGIGVMRNEGYSIIGKILASVDEFKNDECDIENVTDSDKKVIKELCEKYNISTDDLKTKLYMVIS